MPLTAEQIARKLGISNATVSRVLNNSPRVNPATREAVLALVKESGGMPKLLGPRAKSAPQKPPATPRVVQIINVLPYPIPRIDPKLTEPTPESGVAKIPQSRYFAPESRLATSFSRHIMGGVIEELRHFGYRAMVQVTEGLANRQLLTEVNAPGMCGLFLMGIYRDEVHAFLDKCRVPVVSFISWDHCGWPDFVGIDNYRGIRLGFDHLVKLGHKHIGYVAGGQPLSTVFSERLVAYQSLLAIHGMPYRPDWVSQESVNLGPIQLEVERILSTRDRPTAMLCCFDGAAVAVKRAADRLGLRVPEDLSVVGFDDEDVAQLFTPPLTTIRVPTGLMGKQAVHLMMMRQERAIRPGEGASLRVTPSLIVRQSTDKPALKSND